MKNLPFSLKNSYLGLIVMAIICCVLTIVFIFPHKMLAWADKMPVFHRWKIVKKSLFAVSIINSSTLASVFLLSLVRNITFSVQYYLLMLAFGYEESLWLGFMLIWLIYVIKSLIPSISLAELGIRESVALAVMQAFGIAAITAVSSTFLLYIINIALPALAGIFAMRKK